MEQKEIRLIHKDEQDFLPFFIRKDANSPEQEGVMLQGHRAFLLCELQKAAEQIEASEKQRMMLNEHYVWLEHRYAQLMHR